MVENISSPRKRSKSTPKDRKKRKPNVDFKPGLLWFHPSTLSDLQYIRDQINVDGMGIWKRLKELVGKLIVEHDKDVDSLSKIIMDILLPWGFSNEMSAWDFLEEKIKEMVLEMGEYVNYGTEKKGKYCWEIKGQLFSGEYDHLNDEIYRRRIQREECKEVEDKQEMEMETVEDEIRLDSEACSYSAAMESPRIVDLSRYFSRVPMIRTEEEDDEKLFRPFCVRSNVRMAPIFVKTDRTCMDMDDLYRIWETGMDVCQEIGGVKGRRIPWRKKCRRQKRVWGRGMDEDESGEMEGWFVRFKIIMFHDNIRPVYFGTMSRYSEMIRPRNPCLMDTCELDYEVDSDMEWEEEVHLEDVEELESDSEEEDRDDEMEDETEEEWVVPHGYLSEDEGIEEEKGIVNGVDKGIRRRGHRTLTMRGIGPYFGEGEDIDERLRLSSIEILCDLRENIDPFRMAYLAREETGPRLEIVEDPDDQQLSENCQGNQSKTSEICPIFD